MIFRSARDLWAFYVIAEVAPNRAPPASPVALPQAGDTISKACSEVNPFFRLL